MTKEKRTHIWIPRAIKYIHKRTKIHPFIISIAIFGIFPYLILSFLNHQLVDDIGLICAFLWMGTAPYIILLAEEIIERLPTQILPLVGHCKEEFNDIYSNFINMVCGMRHLVFGVPFSLVLTIIVYYSFRSSFDVLSLSFLLMNILDRDTNKIYNNE